MKTKLLLITLTVGLLAGCAPEERVSSSAKPPIWKGETKAQVDARFGRPMMDTHTSNGGEVSTYAFGMAQKFIPIYGAFTDTTTLVVRFNSSGRVVSWETETIKI
jgi:hypothetical protein